MKHLIFFLVLITFSLQLKSQVGYCIQLDGSNDYVATTNNPYTNMDLDTGSMAIWFKTGAGGIATQLMSVEGYVNLALDNGGVILGCSDGSCISTVASSASGYNDNQWHFAVMTWQTNVELKLYLDGVLVDQTVPSSSPNPDALNRPLTFGVHPALVPDYYSGYLDDASIWSKKLTLSEITSLMNSCLVGNETGLLGHWKFNTGVGTTDPDMTNNNHSVTLINGTLWNTPGIQNCCSTASVTQSFGVCQGDAVTVGVNTYSVSGTYVDTLIAMNGCDSIVTTNLTVFNLPNVQFGASNDTFCLQDGSIVLSGGTPSGGTYSGPGVTGNTFNPSGAGGGNHSLIYTFTDQNGCTDSAGVIYSVDICMNLSVNSVSEANIFPNPAVSNVTITSDRPAELITLMNVEGQVVMQISEPTNKLTLDVSDLPIGLYFVRVQYSDHSSFQKFLKSE